MPTLYTDRLIIVVQEAHAAAANSFAAQVDTGGAGDKTFTALLSANGSLPASHRWCSWALKNAERIDITGRLATLVGQGRVSVFDANTNTPQDVLTALSPQPVRVL